MKGRSYGQALVIVGFAVFAFWVTREPSRQAMTPSLPAIRPAKPARPAVPQPPGRQIQSIEAPKAQNDTCSGREYCAIAYLAPWCPACKRALPRFLQAREQWRTSKDKPGWKFIIGADTPEKNAAMARSIGEGAFTDDDKSFARKHEVRHFPTLWIVDRTGKILHIDGPAFAFLEAQLGKKR